jgi:N-acetylmuramoyl-L-alanine amidase
MIPQLIIGLDPGHGGEDTGCIFGDFREAEWTWALAERVIQLLCATSWPLTLKLSRCDRDHDPSLEDRAAAMAMAKADFVISLHANATSDLREHGALGFHVDGLQSTVGFCEALLTTLNRPGEYAQTISGPLMPMRSQIHIATQLDLHGAPSWKRRPWNVLHWHRRPAALIEYGYASNPVERTWLLSETGRDACAWATVEGIRKMLLTKKMLN